MENKPNKIERTELGQVEYDQETEVLVGTVVQQIQAEVGSQLMQNPGMSVQEIKLQAMNRFIDLINKGLLTNNEAEKCYRRFAFMVDFYYGT